MSGRAKKALGRRLEECAVDCGKRGLYAGETVAACWFDEGSNSKDRYICWYYIPWSDLGAEVCGNGYRSEKVYRIRNLAG